MTESNVWLSQEEICSVRMHFESKLACLFVHQDSNMEITIVSNPESLTLVILQVPQGGPAKSRLVHASAKGVRGLIILH